MVLNKPSGLRQRHTRATSPSPDRHSASTTIEPMADQLAEGYSANWNEQLAQARQRLAEKVEQQLQQDGMEYISPTAAAAASLETETNPDEAKQVGERVRRGSAVSESTDDDGEHENVRQLLLGWRTPERASPPAAGSATKNDSSKFSTSGLPRPQPPPAAAPEEDLPTCRICFDGEDPELGKLFSPCKCRGTSRFVHQICLQTWRAASPNSTSFYRCDQCRFQYKFRRTALASIVSHKSTLFVTTLIVFIALLYLAGFLANFLIAAAEHRRNQLSGTFLDDLFISDHVILGEGVRDAVEFISSSRPAGQQALERPWLFATGLHFVKGLSLVGIVSLFQSYVAATFFSPLGRGLFRAMRPHRGGARRDGTAGNISQLVIVAFVLIGAAKAVVAVYAGVKWGARKILSRVENLVLQV